MSDTILAYISAAVALVGLMLYAILAGADFGGGVWDLFARGSRRQAQRDAIAHAMGPVWEANHVWLIFVIVMTFTCFPRAYTMLATAMFVPFHLAVAGIILRGAAFIFRGHHQAGNENKDQLSHWGLIFGISSVITPLLLGASFGALTAGDLRAVHGRVESLLAWPLLQPYPIGCALLALSSCSYLAAVYLLAETKGELREDFRRRAIVAGTTTAALAGVVLALAVWQAPHFFHSLFGARSMPVLVAGLLMFGLSAWGVYGRRYSLSRFFAAGQIVLLLAGWGLAQEPYIIYPDLTLTNSLGSPATIRFLLISLPFGLALVVPSLLFLLRVFKRGYGESV